LFKEALDALLIKLVARIQVICVLFYKTNVANQGPMVTTVPLSKLFWMILAKNLEIIFSLSNQTFDNIVNFERDGLISFKRTVVFAVTP
jgi:hypothetical protein